MKVLRIQTKIIPNNIMVFCVYRMVGYGNIVMLNIIFMIV